jgi:hypothetical protein
MPSTVPTRTSSRRPGHATRPRYRHRGPGAAFRPPRRDREVDLRGRHHTTFQHAHFQFSLENVSRSSCGRFSLSPFYNSEQVSQRYVEVKNQLRRPPMGAPEKEIYERTAPPAGRLHAAGGLLTPVAEALFGLFRAGRGATDGSASPRRQEARQEIARYVCRLRRSRTCTTVSGVTLPVLAPLRGHGRAGRAAQVVGQIAEICGTSSLRDRPADPFLWKRPRIRGVPLAAARAGSSGNSAGVRRGLGPRLALVDWKANNEEVWPPVRDRRSALPSRTTGSGRSSTRRRTASSARR